METPNVALEWRALLLRIRALNLDQKSGYPEWEVQYSFLSFSMQMLRQYTISAHQIFSSSSFAVIVYNVCTFKCAVKQSKNQLLRTLFTAILNLCHIFFIDYVVIDVSSRDFCSYFIFLLLLVFFPLHSYDFKFMASVSSLSLSFFLVFPVPSSLQSNDWFLPPPRLIFIVSAMSGCALSVLLFRFSTLIFSCLCSFILFHYTEWGARKWRISLLKPTENRHILGPHSVYQVSLNGVS